MYFLGAGMRKSYHLLKCNREYKFDSILDCAYLHIAIIYFDFFFVNAKSNYEIYLKIFD